MAKVCKRHFEMVFGIDNPVLAADVFEQAKICGIHVSILCTDNGILNIKSSISQGAGAMGLKWNERVLFIMPNRFVPVYTGCRILGAPNIADPASYIGNPNAFTAMDEYSSSVGDRDAVDMSTIELISMTIKYGSSICAMQNASRLSMVMGATLVTAQRITDNIQAVNISRVVRIECNYEGKIHTGCDFHNSKGDRVNIFDYLTSDMRISALTAIYKITHNSVKDDDDKYAIEKGVEINSMALRYASFDLVRDLINKIKVACDLYNNLDNDTKQAYNDANPRDKRSLEIKNHNLMFCRLLILNEWINNQKPLDNDNVARMGYFIMISILILGWKWQSNTLNRTNNFESWFKYYSIQGSDITKLGTFNNHDILYVTCEHTPDRCDLSNPDTLAAVAIPHYLAYFEGPYNQQETIDTNMEEYESIPIAEAVYDDAYIYKPPIIPTVDGDIAASADNNNTTSNDNNLPPTDDDIVSVDDDVPNTTTDDGSSSEKGFDMGNYDTTDSDNDSAEESIDVFADNDVLMEEIPTDEKIPNISNAELSSDQMEITPSLKNDEADIITMFKNITPNTIAFSSNPVKAGMYYLTNIMKLDIEDALKDLAYEHDKLIKKYGKTSSRIIITRERNEAAADEDDDTRTTRDGATHKEEIITNDINNDDNTYIDFEPTRDGKFGIMDSLFSKYKILILSSNDKSQYISHKLDLLGSTRFNIIFTDNSGAYGMNFRGFTRVVILPDFTIAYSPKTVQQAMARVGRIGLSDRAIIYASDIVYFCLAYDAAEDDTALYALILKLLDLIDNLHDLRKICVNFICNPILPAIMDKYVKMLEDLYKYRSYISQINDNIFDDMGLLDFAKVITESLSLTQDNTNHEKYSEFYKIGNGITDNVGTRAIRSIQAPLMRISNAKNQEGKVIETRLEKITRKRKAKIVTSTNND